MTFKTKPPVNTLLYPIKTTFYKWPSVMPQFPDSVFKGRKCRNLSRADNKPQLVFNGHFRKMLIVSTGYLSCIIHKVCRI